MPSPSVAQSTPSSLADDRLVVHGRERRRVRGLAGVTRGDGRRANREWICGASSGGSRVPCVLSAQVLPLCAGAHEAGRRRPARAEAVGAAIAAAASAAARVRRIVMVDAPAVRGGSRQHAARRPSRPAPRCVGRSGADAGRAGRRPGARQDDDAAQASSVMPTPTPTVPSRCRRRCWSSTRSGAGGGSGFGFTAQVGWPGATGVAWPASRPRWRRGRRRPAPCAGAARRPSRPRRGGPASLRLRGRLGRGGLHVGRGGHRAGRGRGDRRGGEHGGDGAADGHSGPPQRELGGFGGDRRDHGPRTRLQPTCSSQTGRPLPACSTRGGSRLPARAAPARAPGRGGRRLRVTTLTAEPRVRGHGAGAATLVVKSGPRAWREAAVLDRLDPPPALAVPAAGRPRRPCPRHARPRVAAGARDLTRHHARGRFSSALARQAGRALAALHGDSSRRAGRGVASRGRGPPLRVHVPHLEAVHSMSAAAIELTRSYRDSTTSARTRPARGVVARGCGGPWRHPLGQRDGHSRAGSGNWTRLQVIDWEHCKAVTQPTTSARSSASTCGPGRSRSRSGSLHPGRRWSSPTGHSGGCAQPCAPSGSPTRGTARRRRTSLERSSHAVDLAAVRLLTAALEEAQVLDALRTRVLCLVSLTRNLLCRRGDAPARLLGLAGDWKQA